MAESNVDQLRGALAALSDAVTAYLGAEPSGLLRLIEARNLADVLLDRSVDQECRCNLATGFHRSGCLKVTA